MMLWMAGSGLEAKAEEEEEEEEEEAEEEEEKGEEEEAFIPSSFRLTNTSQNPKNFSRAVDGSAPRDAEPTRSCAIAARHAADSRWARLSPAVSVGAALGAAAAEACGGAAVGSAVST
jgi:hypothetical protein